MKVNASLAPNVHLPWDAARCVLCLTDHGLTREHIIPEAIGGRLTVNILCKRCNSRLGHVFEASARKDPSIRLLANQLAGLIPELANRIQDGQGFIASGPGGDVDGIVKGGGFHVKSHKKEDDSLVLRTPEGAVALARLLRKEGASEDEIARSSHRLHVAKDNEVLNFGEGLRAVKWSVDALRVDLRGPLMDSRVPIKIAFEYLALIGASICANDDPLDAIRRHILGDEEDQSILVDRLWAKRAEPIHGIAFEGGDQHAVVQVRLFGSLAFRVHFRSLRLMMSPAIYTLNLESGGQSWVQR